MYFDQASQTGMLRHMLPTVGENGRFGVVAVGNSLEEADQLHERVQSVIQDEAERVTTVSPLPAVWRMIDAYLSLPRRARPSALEAQDLARERPQGISAVHFIGERV
jgi:hypothetical protein